MHAGWMVKMIESARTDLDRAVRRMGSDGQGELHVLCDRPIVERGAGEPMQICPLAPREIEAVLAGRPLHALAADELENLLCGHGARRDAA